MTGSHRQPPVEFIDSHRQALAEQVVSPVAFLCSLWFWAPTMMVERFFRYHPAGARTDFTNAFEKGSGWLAKPAEPAKSVGHGEPRGILGGQYRVPCSRLASMESRGLQRSGWGCPAWVCPRRPSMLTLRVSMAPGQDVWLGHNAPEPRALAGTLASLWCRCALATAPGALCAFHREAVAPEGGCKMLPPGRGSG